MDIFFSNHFLNVIRYGCFTQLSFSIAYVTQGRIQDFKLGGRAHLKKLRSGGRRENSWGISCEKSRFYAKKIIFFPILGGRGPGAPPRIRPCDNYRTTEIYIYISIYAK